MRRLVVCADGTWNTPDLRAPTNVVKLARAIQPIAPDGTTQVVFYDRGVGTYDLVDKLLGGAFGVGLDRNVRNGYLSLVHNYAPGDELYFFGFSRGAYTVRSLAGMIRKVGLLEKEHADRDLQAWQLYRERQAGPDSKVATDFREKYSRWPLRIKLIGVWDTVGALGIPGLLSFIARSRFQFHDVALSRSVEYAYQALAVDEKRRFFRPTLWEQNPEAVGQVLEQAWFPGCHCDVGGGCPESGLSDDALLWMVAKARATGLEIDDEYLSTIARPDALGPLHESRRFPYTAIPAYYRPIGEGVTEERSAYGGGSNEVLDESTVERYDREASYRPRNLVAYLAEHPEPPVDTANSRPGQGNVRPG